MKKTNLLSLLIFISFSPVVLAQDDVMGPSEIIDKLKERYDANYEQSLGMYNYYTSRLLEIERGKKEEEEKKKNLISELERLRLSEKNYDGSIRELHSYITNAIEELPFIQSVASRKKSFYNCILNNIDEKKHPYLSDCEKSHPAKFSTEEKMMIKNYSLFLSIPKKELISKIENTQKQLELYTDERVDFINNNHEKMKELVASAKIKLTVLQKKIDEIDTLKDQKDFSVCGPSMKEIDLENEYIYKGASKKGPFYGLSRDNQDGVGTCFANTAKNLLVGLSDGKMVASFMDIALKYKQENGTYITQGIEAGGACASLLSIKKFGFCDQKFAPFETGIKNEFLEGLLGGKYASVYTQGEIISKVRDFLTAKKQLEVIDSKYAEYFLKNPKELITKLKEDSDIVLPLPIVDITPAQNWQTRQALYVENKNLTKERLAEYAKDVNELDKNFRPKMIQMLLNNESYEEIAKAYSIPFKEFLKKYGMLSSYDQIIKFHRSDFMQAYNEDNIRKLFKTVRFLQSVTNSDSLPTQSFVASCLDAFEKGFDFLEKLNPLVKAINASTETLINGNDFREGAELMQLAIAPTCLNEENRTPIDFDIDCGGSIDNITEMKNNFKGEDLYNVYRMRVVNNLLLGLPVGREISTYGDAVSNHVHTIVGVRYNANLDRCEYKIRESQNGRSEWHSEESIVEPTLGFVEVRRL